MVSINPSQAQPRTQAHAPRAAQANAAQQIPATNFKRHFAIADGDCVFRVLHMDLTNQPGVQASKEQVMELRQTAANYVTEHRQALIAHPSFGGEAGVNDLYDLLMTQGQWNEDAGDMVAPILARVLGRELRILQPAPQGGVYEINDNRIFRPQNPGLPAGRPDTGQPPIHMLHTGNRTHYEYLESRYPQADATAGSVHTPTRPVANSIRFGSDVSSQGGMSGLRMLYDVARREENRSVADVAQPPRKRARDARPMHERPYRMVEPKLSLDNKQVNTESARIMINDAFTQANNRVFRTLTQDEQNAEVTRISRETGYRPSGVRTTLIGGGNKSVSTKKARIEISNAFTEVNDRDFKALTQDEQNAEVTRISRETGYNPSGVRNTLAGSGKKKVESQAARTQISDAFTQANDGVFGTLKKHEQDVEVARISRETGYRPSGVRSTLTGEGNKQVTSQSTRKEITKAFTQANDCAFEALTQDEQAAEVARISRETGYRPSGVRTTLTGEGNNRVRTEKARSEIINAFTLANDCAFGALTHDEQDAEVAYISRETGYNQLGVRATLTGVVNMRVESQKARSEIINAFTQMNHRAFEALTQDEQSAEVARISQETGYNPSGVRTTLAGGGNIKVKTQSARTKISKAFTQKNDRAFRELTQHEQDVEVTRISRATGYVSSGVRKTLTDGGTRL